MSTPPSYGLDKMVTKKGVQYTLTVINNMLVCCNILNLLWYAILPLRK